jgi:hypothetical protein
MKSKAQDGTTNATLTNSDYSFCPMFSANCKMVPVSLSRKARIVHNVSNYICIKLRCGQKLLVSPRSGTLSRCVFYERPDGQLQSQLQ